MNEKTTQVMHECTTGSLAGTMAFPEVVERLAEIGCEQYHADFRRQEKTYYMPDGHNHVEALPIEAQAIAQAFSTEQVAAALDAIRDRQIDYVTFLGRIIDAGCVGYFVYVAGRRTIYLGRSGEMHVEHFPAPAATFTT